MNNFLGITNYQMEASNVLSDENTPLEKHSLHICLKQKLARTPRTGEQSGRVGLIPHIPKGA